MVNNSVGFMSVSDYFTRFIVLRDLINPNSLSKEKLSYWIIFRD